jgi:hypothetical protein
MTDLEYHVWQYNGSSPMIEILVWCRENEIDCWYPGKETIYFYNTEHYTYFLLRWI